MSLMFNAQGVGNAKNYVNKSKLNLVSAKSILSSIKVPSKFSYYDQLRNFSSSLSKIETRSKSINKWIDDSISLFRVADKNAKKFNPRLTKNLMVKNVTVSSTSISSTGAKVTNKKRNNYVNTGTVKAFNVSSIINYSDPTGAKKVENAKSIFEQIGDWFNDRINDLKNVASKVTDTISKGFQSLWNWFSGVAVPTVGEVLVNTAATIGVFVTSVIRGLLNIVEGVGKGVVMLGGFIGGGIATIGTALYDAVTGNGWASTSAMWNGITSGSKAIVSYKYTDSLFNWFYEDTAAGKAINERSYMKYDGVVSQWITTGTEVVGTIAVSVVCPPAGIAVAGLRGVGEGATMAFDDGASYWGALGYGSAKGVMDAAVQGLIGKGGDLLTGQILGKVSGKFLSSIGGKIVGSGVKAAIAGTGDGLMATIDPVAKFAYINDRTFDKGTITNSFQLSEDGTQVIINGGVISMYSVDDDGNQIQQFRINEDGTVEFLVDAKVENDLNYGDLFELNGGWANVGSQFVQGACQSLLFDALSKPMTNIQQKISTSSVAQKVNSVFGYELVETNGVSTYKLKENSIINRFKQKSNYVESGDADMFVDNDEPPLFINSREEAAIIFNDPKQYVYSKLDEIEGRFSGDQSAINTVEYWKDIFLNNGVGNINEKSFLSSMNKYLTPAEKELIHNMYRNKNSAINMYTQDDKDCIFVYTKHAGPAITAYQRKCTTKFTNGTNTGFFDGTNKNYIDDYVRRSAFACNKKSLLDNFFDTDACIKQIDNIISKSPPLKQKIVVYRGADSLFFDNNQLTTWSIGQRFNDSAFFSSSIIESNINKIHDIILEIEIPAGTKAAYLESFSGVTRYNQNELLLDRNSCFEITDMPNRRPDGKMIIKAKLVTDDNIVKNLDLVNKSKQSVNSKYYDEFYSSDDRQVDLSTVIDRLKSSGSLERYEREVQSIKASKVYDFDVAEHNVDHVERVLLYSMHMGEELNLDNNNMNILIEATKYHDCGRTDLKGENHAQISAESAMQFLKDKYSAYDIKKIAAAIEFHESNDSLAAFNEITKKYGIKDSDKENLMKIASLLKDADAIDRVRFPGNLNVNYLRNDVSKQLIKASYQLQEIRGNQSLEMKIKAGKFSTEQIDSIKFLRKKGIPDYLIYFKYKYGNSYPRTEYFISSILNKGD